MTEYGGQYQVSIPDHGIIGQVWLDSKRTSNRRWLWQHETVQGLGCRTRHEATESLVHAFFGDSTIVIDSPASIASVLVTRRLVFRRDLEKGGYSVETKALGVIGRVWLCPNGKWSWQSGQLKGHWCASRKDASLRVFDAFARKP